MNISKIVILKSTTKPPKLHPNYAVITFEELKEWIRRGSFLREIFRYQEAQLLTYRIEFIAKPLLTAILLRLLSRGACYFEDEGGRQQEITLGAMRKPPQGFAKLLWQFIRDLARKPALISQVTREVKQLSLNQKPDFSGLDLSATPVYLRTDLWFGVSSGGSVGHIAGVLNHLDNFTGKPVLLTSDRIPTVRRDLSTHLIYPEEAFWDFTELPSLFFNQIFQSSACQLLSDRELSFIYQRYSTNNYSGVKLAKHYGIPFVLEYNGSEIWVSRNWGVKPLKYESLSERIELLNLKAANVVVVVSQPLKDELVARGIEADKILVNPNGVDSERYSPSIDGSGIRSQYNLDGKIVIGFIGTFGKWHGAEVLATAFGRLLQAFPKYREQVRLLLIGDGVTMPLVKEQLTEYNVSDACILTGLVAQEEGPFYLAACDILACPHVPNADGTPFFGSPTKLFEYMAMGKGIVASDLNQIGEVLEHDRTAWMVKPGDVESLKLGLKVMIDDSQRRNRLGQAARHEVVAKYTWREHTRKIIEKLKECCG